VDCILFIDFIFSCILYFCWPRCHLVPVVGGVDAQLTAAHVGAVHSAAGGVDAAGVGELDKAEALGSAGLTVLDDLDRLDGAVAGEGVAEFLLGGPPGDVTDEDGSHFVWFLVLIGFERAKERCSKVGLWSGSGLVGD